MSKEIKILLADNSFLIREGIKTILAGHKDLKIVAETESGSELFSLLKKPIHFDVIILDYNTISSEELQKLINHPGNFKILCLTNHNTSDIIARAVESGINSHIFKDCDKQEIIDAVYATAKGEKFFCGKVLEAITEKDKSSQTFSCQAVNISNRESEIIKLIAEGLTNKEIADKLCLSSHTITTHRKNIMGKLGISNTAGLVLYAIKENIVRAH